MTLNKDSDYIEDRGDHYSISLLNINDSLTIDLDKRLHVETNVFIAGDLQCDEIIVGGSMIVNGNTIAKVIQANEVYLIRNVSVENSILGRANIQLGKSVISGTLISNGNLLATSDVRVKGNTSVALSMLVKGNALFNGKVSVGAVLDASYELFCNDEVRISGIPVTKYGRYSDGEYVFVVTDNMMSISVSSGLSEIYDNMAEKIEFVKNPDTDLTNKEKSLLKCVSWIENISEDIRKKEA